MQNLLGVVATGGKSSRMGSDKGLLMTGNGTTWAEKAFFLLEKVCEEVVVSLNPGQLEAFQSIFLPHYLIPDDNNVHANGPLLGLLSVHSKFPSKNILLLACDMIEMQPAVLEELIRNAFTKKSKEAYVYIHHGKPEPLCSFIKGAALQHLAPVYRTGKFTNYSMQFLFEQLDTEWIPLREQWLPFFTNINTPEELKRL